MWMFNVIVYGVGIVLLVLAAVFCLATGLYTAAEWLEDHVKTTFRLIHRGIICCATLQFAWLLFDRQLFWPNLIGLASAANSWCMLKHHYPYHMGFDQPTTIAALVLLVVHQTTWVYAWFAKSGSTWQIACILATVVWPVPTMLLLSAGIESDLPISVAPAPVHGQSKVSNAKSSSPSAQPGSPMFDAARQRLLQTLHHRHHPSEPLLPTDTAQEPDQGSMHGGLGLGLLRIGHSRRGSDSSSDESNGGSFSSSWSHAVAEKAALQQPKQKRHRSRVVQGLDRLWQLLGRHGASLLPVTQDKTQSQQQQSGVPIMAPHAAKRRQSFS